MQNLDNLVNRLLSDAKREAEEITSVANDKASSILNEAKAEIEKQNQAETEELDKKILDMRRLSKVTLELEERDALLSTKGEKIDEILSEIPQAVRNLEKQKYEALIKKMMITSMPQGAVDVYPSKLDKDMINEDFLKEISDELSTSKMSVELTLKAETVDIYGGAILKTSTLKVDCSIKSLLRARREDLEYFVATELFKGLDLN